MANLPSHIHYHVYTGQALPPAWPYAYVLAQNGVYKLVDTPHFYASLRLAPVHVAGLCRWPEEGVLLRVPKIPAKWLRAVLEHARRCAATPGSTRRGAGPGIIGRPVEQMYHFHWLTRPPVPTSGAWRVSVPPQQAEPGRVRYAGGHEPTVVLDLHSHHEMSAHFSPTDNRDEQGCRFYAVIGRIYSRPEIRVRLGAFGDFVEFPALGLFEGLGPFAEAGQDRAGAGVVEAYEEEWG